MEIKVLENEKDKIKLEIDDMTFVNVLNEKLWQSKKIDYAAWKRDHPYITKPVILVKSKNPKDALIDAAEAVAKDADKILKEFEKEIK